MSCPHQTTVAAYLLAALPGREWQEMHDHVRGCRPCQREVLDLAWLPGLLNRLFLVWRRAGR